MFQGEKEAFREGLRESRKFRDLPRKTSKQAVSTLHFERPLSMACVKSRDEIPGTQRGKYASAADRVSQGDRK